MDSSLSAPNKKETVKSEKPIQKRHDKSENVTKKKSLKRLFEAAQRRQKSKALYSSFDWQEDDNSCKTLSKDSLDEDFEFPTIQEALMDAYIEQREAQPFKCFFREFELDSIIGFSNQSDRSNDDFVNQILQDPKEIRLK